MVDRITTITSAASTYDLTTLAVVKAELGIPTATTTDDAVLTLYIASESIKISALCNRVFARETVSEKFRLVYPYFEKELRLSRWPVGTITSVTDSWGTVLTSSEYEVDSDSGLLYRLNADSGYRIPWFNSKLTVVYQGGYATIPGAVADACIQMVKQRYLSRGRDVTVRDEEVVGVSRQVFWQEFVIKDIPDAVMSLLAPYRKYGLT